MKKKLIAAGAAMLLLSGCGAPDLSVVEESAAAAASASVIASYEAKASEEAAASSDAAAESRAAEEKAAAEAAANAAAEAKAKAEAAKPKRFGERYDSIEDLVAAYEDAGGTCLDKESSGAGTYSTDAVDCDDETVLSIFDSRADAMENAAQVRGLYEGYGMEADQIWLVGRNWIVNAPDSKLVRKKMGGTVEVE